MWHNDIVGRCPFCGDVVFVNRYTYCCASWDRGCKFKIEKRINGVWITTRMARQLLASGETDPVMMHPSGGKRDWPGKFVLMQDGTVWAVGLNQTPSDLSSAHTDDAENER